MKALNLVEKKQNKQNKSRKKENIKFLFNYKVSYYYSVTKINLLLWKFTYQRIIIIVI